MKQFFYRLFCGIIIFSCFQSCRTSYGVSIRPELEQAFVGRNYAEIIEAMGAPERITPDGKDGQILVYEDLTFSTDGHVNMWTNTYEAITTASKGYIHLYMNPSNECYLVKTNKEREESAFSKGKTIGLIAGIGGGLVMLLTILTNLDDFY